MWPFFVAFITSIKAANVVLFPDPVSPVTKPSPVSKVGIVLM